jgi:hypothetical protein
MSNNNRETKYVNVTLRLVRATNHSCSGKAISIEYSECVLLTLGIRHAFRMYHDVICGHSSSTKKVFHIISIVARLWGKGYWTYNVF